MFTKKKITHGLSINLLFTKNLIIVWAVLLLFFTPAALMYGIHFSALYEYIKYLRCAVCLIFVSLSLFRNGCRTSKLYLSLYFFFISLLISSLFGDLNIFSWINTMLSIIGIYYFIEYYSRKDIFSFLYYCFLYFFVLLAINNILMIVSPNELITVRNQLGNQSFYFLTSKNTFAMFCFPLLLFSHLCYEQKMISNIVLILSTIFAIMPILIVHSVTSTVCVLLFEFVVILLSKKQGKIFNAKFWIILITILSALQFAFTYIFSNETVQYIIITLLKKDPTLSGRSFLFTSAHELIGEHLLLGMGNGMDGYYYYTVAPGYDTGGIMWAHNTSLDLLTQGGMILFIFFYVVMFFAFKNIFMERKHTNRNYLIIICMLAIYTVMGFTERFGFRYDLHLVFALASVSNVMKKKSIIPLIKV